MIQNKFNSFKNTTNSHKFIEKIIPLCSDDCLLNILNHTISNFNIDGFKTILRNAPHISTKFRMDLTSIFENDIQKKNLSLIFTNALNNHFLEHNQLEPILQIFDAINIHLEKANDPNLAKIYSVIYNFSSIIHIIDNQVLSEITNNYFKYLQAIIDKESTDSLQKEALVKQFTHLFLIFSQEKNELIIDKKYHEPIRIFLQNQSSNQSARDVLQYFREFDLKEKLSDTSVSLIHKKKI